MEIRVHTGTQYGDASNFIELGREGVVIESTCNENVTVCVCGFSCSSNKISSSNGTEFGADENCGYFFLFTLKECCLSADESTPPPPPPPPPTARNYARKIDMIFFAGLLNTNTLNLIKNYASEFGSGRFSNFSYVRVFGCIFHFVNKFIILINSEISVWRETFNSKRTCNSYFRFIYEGFVI